MIGFFVGFLFIYQDEFKDGERHGQVAQDAACAKFKAQFPHYDMLNKGKDCDDGRGTFANTFTDVINEVHRETGAPYAFLRSCLNPDGNSQISILVCKSKCKLKCNNAYTEGREKLMKSGKGRTPEAREKLQTEFENCRNKCH